MASIDLSEQRLKELIDPVLHIVRCKRKTIALRISDDLQLLIRAPYGTQKKEIETFVEKNRDWIYSTAKRILITRARQISVPQETLKKRARESLPCLTMHYAEQMGVTPSYVKITSARKRFGSCNAANGICYSCYLMLYPQKAIEYVVVHELAHIVHKNHSRAFYQTVASILPDYRQRMALLKQAPCQELPGSYDDAI